MNRELMEALDVLEKEKNISKDTLLEAIEQSLIQACLLYTSTATTEQTESLKSSFVIRRGKFFRQSAVRLLIREKAKSRVLIRLLLH